MNWTHGFLGYWVCDYITSNWGVRHLPAVYLVGPDGKIMAVDLLGEEIKKAVAKAGVTRSKVTLDPNADPKKN
jgi:hypothetical protein